MRSKVVTHLIMPQDNRTGNNAGHRIILQLYNNTMLKV
jgi:hypothetical protein